MHEAQLSRLQTQRVRDRLPLPLRPILNHCVLLKLPECAEFGKKCGMMETYGSARPGRAQIEDSGFLNVRNSNSSAPSNDKSNHDRKVKFARARPSPKCTDS